MYLISGIFFILLNIFCLYFKSIKNHLRAQFITRHYAGPKAYPLIGNAYRLVGAKPEEALKIVIFELPKYGDTVRFWVGMELNIFMMNTKDLEYILGTNHILHKSSEYDSLKNWLCEGLLISKPSKWFKRRRILTPAFHFKILEQFVEIFDRTSGIFVQNLLKEAELNEGLINIEHWVNLVTLDVICGKFWLIIEINDV